jgi:hypothetical protein
LEYLERIARKTQPTTHTRKTMPPAMPPAIITVFGSEPLETVTVPGFLLVPEPHTPTVESCRRTAVEVAELGAKHLGKHVMAPSPVISNVSKLPPLDTRLQYELGTAPLMPLLSTLKTRSIVSVPSEAGNVPVKTFVERSRVCSCVIRIICSGIVLLKRFWPICKVVRAESMAIVDGIEPCKP